MKRMVALLCAGVLSASLCASAFAGEGKRFEKGQEKRLDKMSQELNLTAEQKTKVSAIFKESTEKRKAEMQKIRELNKATREETDKKLQAVFTPDQLVKYEKMKAGRKAEMEKKMKDGQGRHGDEKPGDEQCHP